MSADARSTIFREVNERIAQIAGAWEWEETQGFLCECLRGDCTHAVHLTREQYEAVRAGPARFVTIPGHERPDQDRVLERHDGFVVVDTLDQFRRAAELQDPRRTDAFG